MPNTLQMRTARRNRRSIDYDDYYINQRRLADILKIGDFIPPFGWMSAEVEDQFARMLLGHSSSDLRPNRIPLFVCPECADYGCGVGTCEVTFTEEKVTWFRFGWETDYEDELAQETHEVDLRFDFEASHYTEFFSRYLLNREQGGAGNPLDA